MIQLKTYNRNQLSQFIDDPGFTSLPFLPISYHRAVSHINNPRAADNDTLLILAFEDDEMVGYLGVLADWIYDDTGQKTKCGWLSCMWIDPKCRGKGISKKLVATALEKWDKHILVTEFTVAAKGLYDKTGAFQDLQIKQGVRIYIRSDLEKLLPPKGENFERLRLLWKCLDKGFNLLFDLRFRSAKKPPNWEYSNVIDAEINHFIHGQLSNQLFRRQAEELNWILNYPWIISAEPDEISQKYYFSSVANHFSFTAIKLRDSYGKLVAFLILARRDFTLKIPYCYFDEKYLDDVLNCIRWHLNSWRIKTCTLFHESLVQAFRKNKHPALFLRTIQRHYIISKVFEQFPTSKITEIQDGDADCAFT